MTKNKRGFFAPPVRQGQYSAQAHVKVPEGLIEEEYGREGFYGPASHIYHKKAPTSWVAIEGDCRPRAFDLNKWTEEKQNFQIQRLFYNSVTQVSILKNQAGQDPFLSRNADGDQIQFIHSGSGTFESDFGSLEYKKGDYIYIPRACTYRFLGEGPQVHLIIEAINSSYTAPDRGLLGHHALYDRGVLRFTELKKLNSEPTNKEKALWEIKVKRGNRFGSIFYDYNPMDVAGVKGDISPFALNMKDICPVMSHRNHLPPSVHSTFVGDQFVICSFVPRPMESAPGAQRVPFFHRNVDFDELIFYHAGDFFSRDHIKEGWASFHPTGVHHGPHPSALQKQFGKSETDEYAVMIDSRIPLEISDSTSVVNCEWQDYWKSWQ